MFQDDHFLQVDMFVPFFSHLVLLFKKYIQIAVSLFDKSKQLRNFLNYTHT